MSTWNHRVVKRIFGTGDTQCEEYAIYEAHYNDQGVAEAITVSPTAPGGDTVEDLRWVLEHMLKALDKPVLNYEEF